MSLVALKRSIALAGLLLAAAPLARAQEADDATRRARARDEWYNETPRDRGRAAAADLSRTRGPWSPEFRRFMMEAAARERQKWGALIPGNGGWQGGVSPADRSEAGTTSWLNLGPTKADYIFNGVTLFVTDAGRVRSFAPHPQDPNTLYVAFSGGGVWKTINGGTTWAPLTEGVGSLSVGSLAMDPANPNTLYLGLGDPFDGTGLGLLKTTDGGANWSNPVFLGNSTVIPQVFVSPANSSIVLAATDKGLYRSIDGGANFSLVPIATGQPTPPYVWSIASTGGTNLVLTLEATLNTSTGQIWYSGDNGATWSRGMNVTSPAGIARMTVASAPSSPNIVYALASTTGGNLADIFRSTSGGQFWRSLHAAAPTTVYTNPIPGATGPSQLFNTQGWYDQMLIVNPANPNEVFFGGALHTAKVVVGSSVGARDRWTVVSEWLGRFGLPYVHADAHAAAYDAAGRLYFGTDGGIFQSFLSGFTDAMNIGITTHLVYNLGSSTVNRSLVVGGFQDNGTRTRSGATSIFNQTIGGDGFGCDVNAADPTKVLGSLYNARVMKSTDSGLHFAAACVGIPECNTNNAPFYTKIVPWTGSASGDVVFTHSNTTLYKSTNYADTWTPATPVPANTIRNIGVAQSNVSTVGVVTSGGHYYLSTNAGSTWTEFAALPNNGLSLSFIWFDRLDPNIVYVSSVAPDQTKNHLWKSINFGTSWTVIDGGGFPTGIPVDVVKTDASNPNIVYAGTHLGVYRSDNGGTNWVRYGAGMPLVEVTDVYVSADSSLVRASTFGRGFWELLP